MFLDGKVHDPQRVDFMHRSFLELGRALHEGLPISEHFAWSLLDNFEWADGYKQRFGLTYVDFQTQKRIPKESFDWYRQVIASGGKSLYGMKMLPPLQVTFTSLRIIDSAVAASNVISVARIGARDLVVPHRRMGSAT